ncbi:DKNYY domain-containing protein, partial [Hungatella sp.]
TFEVLTAGYARDRLHVFIRDRAFKADPKTFFILQDTYAQDCDHMYRNGFIVDDVNRSIT